MLTSAAHRISLRLPNWVGDVCMSLPALRLLGDSGCSLDLLSTRGWAQDLLAGLSFPLHSLPTGIFAGAAYWRSLANPYGLLLTNSLGSALQARLGGCRAVGYAGEGRSLLLRRSLPRPRLPSHEVERLFALALALLKELGIAAARQEPEACLGLPLHPDHQAAAAEALRARGIEGSYLLIAPLAAGSIRGQSKVWPDFPALCQELCRLGQQLIVCPGPGEEAAAAEAAPGASLLTGIGLGTYAALCATADLVIANDSGPAHLAAAVAAPVIALFGTGEPWRTAPWGGNWLGSATAWPSCAEVLQVIEERLHARLSQTEHE